MGRVDTLRASGQLDALHASGERFSEAALNIARARRAPRIRSWRAGPTLMFERLWEETGIGPVLCSLLTGREFLFPVERNVFHCTAHEAGSDRAADKRCVDYSLHGSGSLDPHRLHRTMAWLGDEMGTDEQTRGDTACAGCDVPDDPGPELSAVPHYSCLSRVLPSALQWVARATCHRRAEKELCAAAKWLACSQTARDISPAQSAPRAVPRRACSAFAASASLDPGMNLSGDLQGMLKPRLGEYPPPGER